MTHAKYDIETAQNGGYIIQAITSDGSKIIICSAINLFWATRIKNALNDGK
jgi:hypothetical protein